MRWVLKTLGATRRTLISAYVLEYSLLGLATALFALLAGGLAAWFVIKMIMGFTFTPAAGSGDSHRISSIGVHGWVRSWLEPGVFWDKRPRRFCGKL